MISWVNERLVVVENASAGMVWAPEAIWDPEKGERCQQRTNWTRLPSTNSRLGQYMAYWASKFVSHYTGARQWVVGSRR
jgi:hypothetical protein